MLLLAALAAWLTIPPDRIAHVETPSQVVVVVAPKNCEVREVRVEITVQRKGGTDTMQELRGARCKPVAFRFPAGGEVVGVMGWER